MTAQALISGRERLLVEAELAAIYGVAYVSQKLTLALGAVVDDTLREVHEVIELILLLALALLVVGLLMAASNSVVGDAPSSMEDTARRDRHRIARAQARAESEINRVTHDAFEEMVEEIDRARREADS